MPRYEFQCNQCKEKFEVSLSIKDKESAKIVCPKCESEDTVQVYSAINVNTKYSAKNGFNGCCGDCSCCR
jgi:putative FmdB family regulatory protein